MHILLLKGRATHLSWTSVSPEAGQLAFSDNLGALVPTLLEHWWVLFSCVLCAQSCLTLCETMDGNPPGSSVHGILQVRILECVAISFSRGSSQPRDWTWISSLLQWQVDSLPLRHLGILYLNYGSSNVHLVEFGVKLLTSYFSREHATHSVVSWWLKWLLYRCLSQPMIGTLKTNPWKSRRLWKP